VQHGQQTPNTHNCDSTPIDRIFVLDDFIPAIHSGYLAFGEGIPSNHQAVWIDIPIVTLGWFAPPNWVSLEVQQLKCENPRIIACYIQALKEELTKLNTCQWLEDLALKVKGTLLNESTTMPVGSNRQQNNNGQVNSKEEV